MPLIKGEQVERFFENRKVKKKGEIWVREPGIQNFVTATFRIFPKLTYSCRSRFVE